MISSKTPQGSVSSEPLHPNVIGAGWISFFTDLGSELIYPLLPAFITGSQGLNAGKTMLGLIEGLSEATPAIVKLWSGILADRMPNRKWLIFLGYLLSSVIKPFIGLATSAWQVLGLRFTDKIGKGVRGAPRDALISDSVSPNQRGRAFGFHRSMDHLGALIGSLIAWFLVQQLGLSVKTVIVFSVIPGLLCLLTIGLLIREIPGRTVSSSASGRFIGLSELPRPFWMLNIGLAGCAIANSSDAFLLLRAQDMGVPFSQIPLLWAFLHLVKSITCYLGGHMSDRFGSKRVTSAGWLLYSGVYFGFAHCSGSMAAWGLFCVYGIFFGLTEGSVKAWVADIVPAEKRGTGFGFTGLMEGLMLLPASILTGFLWDNCGYQLPLMLGSAVALISALWLTLAVPATSKPLQAAISEKPGCA